MANKICQKCGKMLDEDTQFYTCRDKSKTDLCKKCLTMHIDNFDENTYLWLLEKMDLPYIPSEWNSIRDAAFAKDPNKLNGMSVFGKYLSKMKLKQWIDPKTHKYYGWADTERLLAMRRENQVQNDEERAAYDAEIKAKYDAGEISEAEYKTLVSPQTLHEEYVSRPVQLPTEMPQDKYYEEGSQIVESTMNDMVGQLSQEDKTYLAMKWSAKYQPQEWIELEKDFNEMTNSFDIQDADTRNTLILLCKTNLKMNQCLDENDIEGYQKLSKVSDSLRKSAKFTAAQNKEDKSDYVDSVGELVAMCERDGFIPRFATDIPQDKVDATLKDMENYLKKLVTQDLGFGQQIEDALKKIQLQKEMSDADITQTDEVEELTDEDHEELIASVAAQKEIDAMLTEEEDY